MAIITTGSNPKALWPGIHAWFGRMYDELSMEWREIFDDQMSDKAYEEDVQITGFGLVPEKSQGAAVTYDSESQGWLKRYTHIVYAMAYAITEEEAEDNLYEQVSNTRAKALGFSFRQTKENVCANVLNRAFSSSYLGGDGKELLATDHPNRAGTWQNEPTVAADLSEASLEDLCILINTATNEKGLKISLKPKKLIIPPALTFEAARILRSVLQNDTANNAVNALRATGAIPDYTVNHYLTDADAWFVKTNCPNGLTHFTRKKVKFSDDSDFNTGNFLHKGRERYAVGWTDPRGCYGSPGA